MINYKTNLSKEERKVVFSLLNEINDPYGDFYLTRSNLRLFIKENLNLLFEGLQKGDKIVYDENGVAVVIGFSDKMPRKYVKILTKNQKSVEDYIKVIVWNLDCDLYIKIKKNNPIKDTLLTCGFEFFGGRGREVLLKLAGKKKC